MFGNDTQWLFTIYMGKLRDGRFTVWANVKQKFCPGIVFAICTNQLHLPKNGRERLKLVSKKGFEETEHEFPFGTFRPGKQVYHFRRSVAPGSFTPKRPEQSCSIYVTNWIFRKLFVSSKETR